MGETSRVEILKSVGRQHDALKASHPDCKEEIRLVHSVHVSPRANGNGAVWRGLTPRAEAWRAVLMASPCSQACCACMLNNTLQPDKVESPKEFREQKRRKRNPSDQQASLPNKTTVASCSVRDPRIRPQAELSTRNRDGTRGQQRRSQRRRAGGDDKPSW